MKTNPELFSNHKFVMSTDSDGKTMENALNLLYAGKHCTRSKIAAFSDDGMSTVPIGSNCLDTKCGGVQKWLIIQHVCNRISIFSKGQNNQNYVNQATWLHALSTNIYSIHSRLLL